MSSAKNRPSKISPKSGGSRGSLFPLGQIVATRGVMSHLAQCSIGPVPYLARHARGDWGLVPAEDVKANDLAVEHGWCILSAYDIAGVRVWIITEADRSVTTLLLPDEY
ncbi:hypothetical protein [Cupriavidus oxalaticus]|uniref:hypothetical protein n=1 Tax=Cupriavidus oxalaticus TaxID=96344 RepID=UPI001E39E12E|nr:hypothetical protein [Cupriavidus oxalaticus]WQD82119.1 hypothetical protein U0036_13570 [Cupriavidus oxalaticus]